MPMFRTASVPILIAVTFATVADAQVRVIDPADNPAVRRPGEVRVVPGQVAPVPGGPAQPGLAAPLQPLPMLQAQFAAAAGSSVSFGSDSHLLDETARQILARQAEWLRSNPMLRASIEGHSDGRQTRDQALALGERRAAQVYSYLVSLGVPPQQLTVTSWGRERPLVEATHEATWLQNSRVVTMLVR